MKQKARTQKRMSLNPQTIRVQHRLAEWSKSGRKHWDLYRWLLYQPSLKTVNIQGQDNGSFDRYQLQ